MADIIEFLEARIAEDESAVRAVRLGLQGSDLHVAEAGPGAAPLSPARVLAECAAKRKILGNVPLVTDIPEQMGGTSEYVLMCLASVYSWHPEYQEGWSVAG